MGLLDILHRTKNDQIEELRRQISLIEYEKNHLELFVSSLKQNCENFEVQINELKNKKDELEIKLEQLQRESEKLNSQKRALLKENEINKTKLKELTKDLSAYRTRFGDIPQNTVVSEEGVVTDYDRDKSFFDLLEKEKGNPFSNDQVKAIRYPCDKHMRIIAGAGSGKTETICAKAAYFINMEKVPESRICMITFTKKAAGEMKKRVNEFLGVDRTRITIGTFHSVFQKLVYILVKEFPSFKFLIRQGNPDTGQIAYRNSLSKLITKYSLHDFNKLNETDIEARLSFWLNMGYSGEEIIEFIAKHFDEMVEKKKPQQDKLSERFQTMMKIFENVREDQNIVVYDDYLLTLYKILKNSPEARSYLQGTFDYIFIDEFQDTNPLQMNIIKLLCPPVSSLNSRLIIVGDDDQSIYMFRGSDPSYIKEFDRFYETKTFELMTNYRSKEDIVTSANRLISYNDHDRIAKSMVPHHDNNGDAYLVQLDDIYKEADWIINRVKELGANVPFKYKNPDTEETITELPNYIPSVIIYRSVSQLQGIIRTLDQKDVPYVIEKQDDLLGIFKIIDFKLVFDTWIELINSKELPNAWTQVFHNIGSNFYIKNSLLNSNINMDLGNDISESFESFQAFINKNTRSSNNTRCIKPYLNLVCALQEEMPVKITEMLDCIFEFPKIKANLSREDLDYIRKECESYNSWNELYGYYQRLKKRQKEMNDKLDKYHKGIYNALYLLTIHKSKGLSFENVFIIGCYDQGIPSHRAVELKTVDIETCKQKAEPPTTIEEERRLMYVAVTRAKKNLYVTFPSTLQGKPCVRSQFLQELYLTFSRH